MLISPAEPARLKELGTVGMLPEVYGADFMWIAKGKKVGVQRKELKDFIASAAGDDRLTRETKQMKGLDIAMLLVEGVPKWDLNDELIRKDGYGPRWTKASHQGILWTIQDEGIWVTFTTGMDDTMGTIRRFRDWTNKVSHRSLLRRPGPTSLWGDPDNIDFVRHLVMGLPSVGAELAIRIVDHVGCPFGWVISKEDLEKVPGIGKKKAEKIYATLAPVVVP